MAAADQEPRQNSGRQLSGFSSLRTKGLPGPPPLLPPPVQAPTPAEEPETDTSSPEPDEHRPGAQQAASTRARRGESAGTETTAQSERSGGPATPSRRSGRASSSTSRRAPGSTRSAGSRRSTSTREGATAGRSEAQTRPVAAYLPADLRPELLAAAQRSGDSYAGWLLDAYEQVFEELDVVYQSGSQGAPRRSGLPQRRRRRRDVGIGVQVQFMLTGEELSVLESHMERLGVESRSEFFTTIVELGLRPQRRRGAGPGDAATERT